MKHTATFSFLIASSFLVACGGGGGGSDSDGGSVSVAGRWSGIASVSENNCGLPLDLNAINFAANVSQDGSLVSLVDELNDSYSGSTIGEDGFLVTAPPTSLSFPLKTECSFMRDVEYHGISPSVDDGNSNTASVRYGYRGTCVSHAGECRLTYIGTAQRSGGPVTTTIPSATPTPIGTPTKGACAQLQQKSYAGDASCGLSSTSVSVIAGGIILEPLGTNGATSFMDSATDPSLSSSVRTDLSVGGVAGYSCTMSCSPPSEFTVKCVKEGGTSCSEKF